MRVHENLGDASTDQIVQQVMDLARQIWPEGTQQFEDWVNQQLANYGISYTKYEAEQKAAQASAFMSQFSPWLWLGAGALAVYMLRK